MNLPAAPAGTSWAGEGYFGDFDGDGDVDRVITVAAGGVGVGMRLLRNAGGGAFVDGGAASPMPFRGGVPATFERNYHLGDFDEDGDLDIVQNLGGARVIFNGGNGTFTVGPAMPIGLPKAVADLDKDGHLDLVCSTGICFGSGQGTFVQTVAFAPFSLHELAVVAVGDLDGDGLLDVALPGHSWGRIVVWYRNLGARQFAANPWGTWQPGSLRMGVAIDDVDRDGDRDLLVWPGNVGSEHSVQILLNDGTGRFPSGIDQIAPMRGPLADVDGDGDLDAIGETTITCGAYRLSPAGGFRQQFGTSCSDAAGFAPTLGVDGELAGGGTMTLRLRGAPGFAWTAVALGNARVELLGWPQAGSVLYVQTPIVAGFGPCSGAVGEGGTGSMSIHLGIPVGFGGLALHLQAFVFDVSDLELLHTNGLSVTLR